MKVRVIAQGGFMFRRTAAVLAAISLSLLLAATAFAALNTYTLNQFLDGRNPDGIAWDDFQVDCEGVSPAADQVAWVFVAHVTSGDPSTFLLTATFEDSSGDVSDQPPEQPIPDSEPHWIVYTSLTTLLDATITGDGTIQENDDISNSFELSHVCPNPGNEIPEAPMSALLILSAGIVGLAYVGWRSRRSHVAA
jgi:hypothetical protein